MRFLFIVASLCALTSTHTAEYAFDLRLDLTVAPGSDEIEFANGETASISQELGIRIAPGLFWSMPVGDDAWDFVIGGQHFFRTGEGEGTAQGNSFTLKQTMYGATLLVGAAYRWEQWRFEATPFIGIGTIELDYSSATGNDSSSGLMFDYGLLIRAIYRVSGRWSVGGVLGYDAFSSSEIDTAGGGVIAGVSAGWAF